MTEHKTTPENFVGTFRDLGVASVQGYIMGDIREPVLLEPFVLIEDVASFKDREETLVPIPRQGIPQHLEDLITSVICEKVKERCGHWDNASGVFFIDFDKGVVELNLKGTRVETKRMKEDWVDSLP